MINCIIIDDEAHNITLLKNYIQRLSYLHLLYATTDPIEGLSFISTHDYDLIFLDIQMEELSGMGIAKLITEKSKIIFTTASTVYTVEAFDEGVLDYLVKPISFDRFLKAAQRALNHKQATIIASPLQQSLLSNSTNDIFLKGENKGKMTRLRLDDVYYVQGLGNYVGFHTKNGVIMALLTFRDLEERLPEPRFLRVHKSFIVAYEHITAIDSSEIIIIVEKKTVKIPIGATYREKFFSIINGTEKK